jgi:hypothetical protein
MGKVIADLATSAASATFSVENATSSVDYVLSGTDGSANQILKTDGSGNLSWTTDTGGSLVYLASSRSTVDAATVNFQSFKHSDYLFYQVVGMMGCVSDGPQLDIRLMDGASAITTSNYRYLSAGSNPSGYNANQSDTNDNWTVINPVDNSGPMFFSFQLHLQDATDDDYDGALIVGNFGFVPYNTTNGGERTVYGTYAIDNANIDGIQFYHSTGDIDYHKIVVYGMKGS